MSDTKARRGRCERSAMGAPACTSSEHLNGNVYHWPACEDHWQQARENAETCAARHGLAVFTMTAEQCAAVEVRA